ncbi:MAG TPA: hypothetical protein VFM19_05785 [Candidatus Limnocylindria bacterium]|nr:hypothetical protein [Candidatus Limnocylindria bacterium]
MTITVRLAARLRLLVVPIGAIALSIGALAATGAIEPPGCQAVVAGSVLESTTFTPWTDMRSRLLEPPIRLGASSVGAQTEVTIAGPSLDGLPLWWSVATESGEVYQYFAAQAVPDAVSTADFFGADGLLLERSPGADDAFIQYLLTELGERAVPVNVGGYQGALTWADPLSNGVRTHNLYWFDGAHTYALVGDRPAEALINLGRNLACR